MAIPSGARFKDMVALKGTVIDSLDQLLSKKRQIKQGMMQELLTGRIRLA